MNRQLFEHHSLFGYRFIPNIKARVEHESGGYLVRTNNKGFRCNHQFDDSPNNLNRRLLLFGDSFTAGDGVSNKYRYGDLIEKRIDGVEVWNYGISGTGTDQHYLIFQEFASELDASAVIISVLVENIRRIVARFRPFVNLKGREMWLAKPYYTFDSDQLILNQVPVPVEPFSAEDLPKNTTLDKGGRFSWFRKTLNKTGFKDFAQRITKYDPVPEYKNPNNFPWKLMSAILEEWISNIKCQVILMPLPLYHHVEEKASPIHYIKRFRELADRTGAIFHNPLEELTSYSLKERRDFRFRNDIHPTPKCHEVIAKSLVPVINKIILSKT